MITQQDLQEAMSYCEGKIDPKREDAILLAACYIIEDHKYKKDEEADDTLRLAPGYSYAPPPEPVETTIEYQSDTEFGRLIHGRKASEIWPIIDELVTEPVQAFNPRLYDALFRKLK